LLDNDYIQSKRDREESLLGDRWIIYPTDIRKVAWDCLSCAAAIYAVAEVPFSIGFLSDVEGSLSSNVTDGLFVAIFGIDILLSFNSAYEDTATGLLVSNRLKIAKRYSKFWLWIDLAAIIPINQIVASLHPTGSKNNLNSTSLLRLCRLSRLAFLYKMLNSQRLSTYMDSINISPQIKNITLLFLQIFLTGHVVCCFWFRITTQTVIGVLNPTDDAVLIHTWATEFGFQNIDIFSQYIASLYWTFATLFTIGYGDISATNEGERVFSIAVMLLGSILFGAIIAKIEDVLDSRNIQKNEIIVKMEEFKEYMEEEGFPSHLRFQAKFISIREKVAALRGVCHEGGSGTQEEGRRSQGQPQH
jgi:Ion transport protein